MAWAQTYVNGIDVSRYQGSINWTSVLNSGTEFAFIKATEGIDYVDSRFHQNMQNATAAGVLAGPYHYARPDSYSTNPLDAVNEANDFLAEVLPYYESGSYLPPVLDVEEFDFTPPDGQSVKNFVSSWIEDFSDTVLDSLGVRPIIYTGKSAANNYFSDSVAADHDLWLAWWKTSGTANPPVQSDTPDWDLWKYWQWTATGSVSGISGNVDRNLFQGTRRQLETELMTLVPSDQPLMIEDFEAAESYFDNSLLGSPYTSGVRSSSYATRDTTEAYEGDASQKVFIDGQSAGWTAQHTAGIGTAGDPDSNQSFQTIGSIGLWIKTDDADLTVRLALDAPEADDYGVARQLIADGQWHLYEWSLEDDSQWESWVGGDGSLTSTTATIDSLLFEGSGRATLYLDSVMVNPLGSLLEGTGLEGDFNADGMVDMADYAVWRNYLGAGSEDVLAGNGDGSGTVDAGDYQLWKLHFGQTTATALAQSSLAVPEPSTLAVLLLAGCSLAMLRRR